MASTEAKTTMSTTALTTTQTHWVVLKEKLLETASSDESIKTSISMVNNAIFNNVIDNTNHDNDVSIKTSRITSVEFSSIMNEIDNEINENKIDENETKQLKFISAPVCFIVPVVAIFAIDKLCKKKKHF